MGAVLVLMAVARRILMPYPIFLVLGGCSSASCPASLPAAQSRHRLPDLPAAHSLGGGVLQFPPRLPGESPAHRAPRGRAGAGHDGRRRRGARTHAGLGWPAAFVLGAIVSPPDAVAATAVARRLRIPHRVVTILEGESLVNDAAALVLYRAVVATVTGTFAPWETVWQFVVAAAVGVALGLLVGLLTRAALRHAEDSLRRPRSPCWLPTRRGSSPSACTHRRCWPASPAASTSARASARSWRPRPGSRPGGGASSSSPWNGVIFVLIGLQLRAIRDTGLVVSPASLVVHGAVISAVAIGVRLPGAAGSRDPAAPQPRPAPPRSAAALAHAFVLAWTGMRGVVSLAAALGLPLTTASGTPFPYRDEIVVLTFEVILATSSSRV